MGGADSSSKSAKSNKSTEETAKTTMFSFDEHFMNEKSTTTKRCNICCGSGYEKQTPTICQNCTGLPTMCMYCENKYGYDIPPFTTCSSCDGCGHIEVS